MSRVVSQGLADSGPLSAVVAGRKKSLRRDIQALRALAVGLVVLNHLWPSRLTGGYIGVDVFFVISGFLITSHLTRELDQTGGIRLGAFWARRARRLLPAAMLVLLVSTLAVMIWLPVTAVKTALTEIGAAGLYILNWVLAESSVNYFTSGESGSIVTHYWSLSVEEQFYLVWPLVIVAVYFLTRSMGKRARDNALAATFGVILVCSLAWGIHSSQYASGYFQTTGRAWEFAAGALLAFVPAAGRKHIAIRIAVVWAAWLAIIAVAVVYDGESGFPGWAALVPVIAAVVIIFMGDIDHSWAPTNATSLAPIQFVGGVSYSLYLWHWPLIFVAPYVLGRGLGDRDKLIILALSLVAAYLSKRYVEDPFLRSRLRLVRDSKKTLLATAASMAVLVLLVGGLTMSITTRATAAVDGLTAQSFTLDECFGAQAELSGASCEASHTLDNPDSVLLNWENQKASLLNGSACQQTRESSEVLTCQFGVADDDGVTNVALVGDSHAGMWASMLSAIAEDNQLRVNTYLKSACPATLDPDVSYKRDGTYDLECREWREAAIAQIAADPNIDVVMTTSIDRSYLGAPDANGARQVDTGAGYAQAWSVWVDAGKRVLAVNEIPEHVGSVPECLVRSRATTDPCTISADTVSSSGPLENAASAMDGTEGFMFVDFKSVFCDDAVCHSVIGGIPAYIDASHMSAPFARSFAPNFRDNAFLGGEKW